MFCPHLHRASCELSQLLSLVALAELLVGEGEFPAGEGLGSLHQGEEEGEEEAEVEEDEVERVERAHRPADRSSVIRNSIKWQFRLDPPGFYGVHTTRDYVRK